MHVNSNNPWLTLFTLLFLGLFLPAYAENVLHGTVSSVHDGDTVTLGAGEQRVHVRLDGIDAPELKQPYGKEARDFLASFVLNKSIVVSWHKKDKYRRTVGTLQVDGRDMNLELLRAGLAWHYTKYAYEQTDIARTLYSSTERQARVQHLGLWQDQHPTPPWDYRKSKRYVR